jgi:hypothetical protein
MSKLLKTLTVGVAILAVVLGVSKASAASYTFSSNLTVGSRGQDVQQLQMILNSDSSTMVAVTGAGSPGMESTYFGALTKAALIKFQAKHGISPTSGYFGPITRAFLATWASGSTTSTVPGCVAGAAYSSTTGAPCNSGTPITVTGGAVSVSLAADNTPARSVVLGQASAELGRFVFSGTGVVTNVTLQQIGLSAYNNTLQNVYLYNGATRLTDSGSVSSNGVITFNGPSGLFTVNGSMEVTVRADLVPGSQNANQTGTVGVELTGFAVSGGAPVSAAISGNLMVIVNVTTAAATFSQAATSNPPASAQVNAGTSNYTIWSNQLGVSTRALNLRSATFRFIGSAPISALSNIKLYVDGSMVGTAGTIQPINGSNYIVFNLTSTPFVLSTGSHTVEVRADIVGGASYSFQISIQNPADLQLEDSQLSGVYVTPTTNGTTVAIPNNTVGNSVLILQGTNSVTIDPAFTTTTITGGATNVPIAQYKFTGYGEAVKITSLVVTPSLTSYSPASVSVPSLNNVSLYANGAQIGSTQNWSGTSTALTFNLGSSLIIPAGQSVILTVKADLISGTSVNYTAGNVSVVLTSSSNNAQGQSSQQLLTIPASNVTSNTLTIGGNTITVAQNASLTNQSVAPNTPNQRIGSFVIQAGSAEGLQVTNLSVGVGSSAGITNLANLRISGTNISVNPVNPQGTNNFSTNFTIPTSQSQIVDVYADIGATVGTATTTLTVTGRGIVSNVSTTTTAVTGQVTTIAQGGVTSVPTIVSSATLPSQYLIGPSSPTIATYNFIATSSAATIQELKFSASSSVANAISSIAISANGQTLSAPVVSGVVDISGLNILIPAGFGGVNVVVTPTYSPVGGVNGIASNSTTTISLIYVKSLSGNQTTVINPSVASQTMTLVSSKPTLAVASPNVSLATGLTEIADITVSADANGAIKVNNLPIAVQSSGQAVVNASSIASSTLQVQNAGGTVISTATDTGLTVTAGSNGTDTISFAGGYQIAAGTSETFRIFATTAPGTGAAPQNQLGTRLGTAGSFTWTDVNGNVGSLTAVLLPSAAYPSISAIVHN